VTAESPSFTLEVDMVSGVEIASGVALVVIWLGFEVAYVGLAVVPHRPQREHSRLLTRVIWGSLVWTCFMTLVFVLWLLLVLG